jgi:tRNA1Val (adenine37-N6)-methyltransferase
MPNPFFSFKQFTVYHHRCAMKVGIDGVLLGAWADVNCANKVLDIGTGSGLIALMLAQRANAQITAIDIEPNAILQTEENIKNSPWKDKIRAKEISIQQFAAGTHEKFDLIVSNPPYFVNSLKNNSADKTTARHTDSLTHEELMTGAKKMLAENGRICLILPVNEGIKCVQFAESIGLHCHKIVYVHPKPAVEAKRVLLQFGFAPTTTEVSELEIETDERHQYSEEFTALAKDFYLKL